MDGAQLLPTILSPAVVAAVGPAGLIVLIMACMLFIWLRGREERQAKINEAIASSLREDQRELFERQGEEIEGLRVDKQALEARLKATEELAASLRGRLFETYLLCRENTHEAANARAVLVAAKIRAPGDFTPLEYPTVPTVGQG